MDVRDIVLFACMALPLVGGYFIGRDSGYKNGYMEGRNQGRQIESVLSCDVNQDGLKDIVIKYEGDNPVIFINQSNGVFKNLDKVVEEEKADCMNSQELVKSRAQRLFGN